MKLILSMATLATMASAVLANAAAAVAGGHSAGRRFDPRQATTPQGDVQALISAVKIHTANINATLASLPTVDNTTVLNVTATGNSSNPNITTEFNEIAKALNASAKTTASTKRSVPLFGRAADLSSCDATCQQGVYSGFGELSSEIACTIAGSITKNAVDLSSSSSVVLTVINALATTTSSYEGYSITSIAGVVTQSLLAGLGPDIGGALATLLVGN